MAEWVAVVRQNLSGYLDDSEQCVRVRQICIMFTEVYRQNFPDLAEESHMSPTQLSRGNMPVTFDGCSSSSGSAAGAKDSRMCESRDDEEHEHSDEYDDDHEYFYDDGEYFDDDDCEYYDEEDEEEDEDDDCDDEEGDDQEDDEEQTIALDSTQVSADGKSEERRASPDTVLAAGSITSPSPAMFEAKSGMDKSSQRPYAAETACLATSFSAPTGSNATLKKTTTMRCSAFGVC